MLGLQHEAAALVEVNEAVVAAAIRLVDDDAALEHIGVVTGVVAGRFRQWQAQQAAQLGEEQLVVGPLAAAGFCPALNEGLNGVVRHDDWLHDESRDLTVLT